MGSNKALGECVQEGALRRGTNVCFTLGFTHRSHKSHCRPAAYFNTVSLGIDEDLCRRLDASSGVFCSNNLEDPSRLCRLVV